jgi:hypothetical protein
MDFWARRKAAVDAEAKAQEAQRAAQDAEAREAAQAEKTDAELLEELGLPEPETLGADGDYKAFMADGVPQRLKSRALRCLWRSNPVLANVDGLVDYGEDFTDAACVVENLQTAYQVGKGMLAHVEEMARQAEAAAAGKAVDEDAGDAPEADADEENTDDGDSTDSHASVFAAREPADGQGAQTPRIQDEDEAPLPPRRRMAFTFDETTA